jgi:hypothetical protein
MRNNVFSPASLSRTQYIPAVKATSPQNPVPTPIAAYLPPPVDIPPASQRTITQRTVGISSNVFDLVNNSDSDIDLGIMYSNGARYAYNDIRSQALTPATLSCSIVTPDAVISEVVMTDDGPVVQDVYVPGSIVTGAYAGNAVVPPLPNPNVITCGRPFLLKLEPQEGKSDC